MSRERIHRAWQVGIVALTLLALGVSLATHPISGVGLSLFFGALVLVASYLRIEAGESSIAFEAAVIFGALIIQHDAQLALVAAATGSGAHVLVESIRRRRWSLTDFSNAAELTFGTYAIGLLYTMAVAPDAQPIAKIAGYILLLIGYLVVQLLLATLRKYFESDPRPLDFRRVVMAQGRTLLLFSPVVAIEVLLYGILGMPGFAIGFLPVLLVSYAMRNEADAEQQNAELVRRNRELAILTENSTKILSAETDEETLRRLMTLLSSLAKMKACAVVTWSPNPDIPWIVYRFGECQPTDQDILRWVDAAGFSQSAPSRAFVFQNDLRRFPLTEGNAIQVLIGIQTPEVIYGILIFETEDASILKAGSLNLLTMLVNQTALSLQDHLLRREMQEKNRELEARAETMRTVLDVSTNVIRTLNVDAAFAQIAQAIRKALGFEVVVFSLRDPKTGEFVRRAQVGLDQIWDELKSKRLGEEQVRKLLSPEFLISHSYYVSHTALRQSEFEMIVLREDSAASSEEWHENDALFVPLLGGEELLGFLSVREPQDRKRPTTEKVEALEVFAVQAVTAVQLITQYEEIERLTIVDSLTEAHNHRHFQQRLREEIKRRVRSGHPPFALALLDIDNFKRINDTYGHPTGDEMLRGLVRILKENKRETDLVARYGGEEFAMILPDTGAEKALEAADRFRGLVAEREFPMPQIGRTLRMTVSIGIAIFPVDGETDSQLIARADAALYQAKKGGKNQVCLAGDAVATES